MKLKIFIVLLMTVSFISALEKKVRACSGGCCESKEMAMVDGQSHEQHKHEQTEKNTSVKKKKIPTEYTCPMHPEVKSTKPGNCPKCGMALVEVKKEKKSLMKQKIKAMKDDKYNCCIDEPCDECLKAHGSCSCKKAVQDGKPVCNECYEGWKRGEGDVQGKTFKDIKKGHDHKH